MTYELFLFTMLYTQNKITEYDVLYPEVLKAYADFQEYDTGADIGLYSSITNFLSAKANQF